MAFVAALMAAEKLLPWARGTSLGITVLLAVLAVSVALVPDRVPGLVLPSSPKAHAAQMTMRAGAMHRDMKHDSMRGGTAHDAEAK